MNGEPEQRVDPDRLQPRAGPADGERDEGDDEDDRRGDAEETARDREVGPADDPVGDDQGLTSSSNSTRRSSIDGSRSA